jgi:hypothetical protein
MQQTVSVTSVSTLFRVSYFLAGYVHEEFVYNADLVDRLEDLGEMPVSDLRIQPEGDYTA